MELMNPIQQYKNQITIKNVHVYIDIFSSLDIDAKKTITN